MASLSIRNMNFTLRTREQNQWQIDAREYEMAETKPVYYYWHVYRKVVKVTKKHGSQISWKFVREAFMTKAQAAAMWNKFFRANKGQYRLRNLLKY